MIHDIKFGRKPRRFSPRIMHLSALLGAIDAVAPPVSVDWTKGGTEFGVMKNDTLGCCTCAAVYHARQIWTLNTGNESTEPDSEVLALYEKACGYNPADPSTDQGGDEQSVLTYLLKSGMPLTVADGTDDKIKAFFEVDPRNIDDIKTVINECGVCYIGFDVPGNIMDNLSPDVTWQLDKTAKVEGGHAVVLVAYDADTVTCISWGQLYKMTWDFFQYWTDEAYAIIDPTWVADGKTPLGLTDADLEKMMAALKAAG